LPADAVWLDQGSFAYILTNECCNYNEVDISYIQLSNAFPIFCN